MANPSYLELERRFERMYLLRDAAAVLEWDASTFMPDGGAQARADQMATLRVIRHELLTAPDLGDLLASAEAGDLDEWQHANVREMRREWIHATAVPSRLVEARSQAVSACEMRWRSARRANDFEGLRPLLEEVLRLTREVAQAKSESLGVSPYDALLDEWEPGGRSADLDRVFGALEAFLPGLVEKVLDHQQRHPLARGPVGPFPAGKQTELAHQVMAAMGFEFDHGRLDVSVHPFCGGVPDDVRITSRWDDTDFVTGLFSVVHETGHALYERGLPRKWVRQPVGNARGMSMHESQSLLWEKQAGRSPEFTSWLAPIAAKVFGGDGPWTGEALLGDMLRVERSLIRVDADEVTYPLHVILRYRLERAMIAGELAVKDLPAAFDDGMQQLVGVRSPNVCDGCLQDIHWPGGMFGYFPTYTLGAITAAQLYSAAIAAVPSIPASLAKGDARPLLGWLRTNVHEKGSLLTGNELITRATGKPLDPDGFRKHLERRYLGA